MNGLSVREVSRILGVSGPRVYRALAEQGVAVSRSLPELKVPRKTVAELLRRWGWVPPALRNAGLSREEVFVLAALARSPLGLRSARSVARAASIAPASAAKALASLSEQGLVEERVQRVAEGDVRDIPVWKVAWRSPAWRTLSAAMAEVILAAPRTEPPSQRSVPSRFAHLFWNEDTEKLDVERDGTLIAERILSSYDAQAIAWAARAISPAHLRRVRGLRNVSPRVAGLADALAAGR